MPNRSRRYDNVLDLEQTLADLSATVERLQQERDDLEIALATTIEHGDAIESQLATANQQLQGEIHERRTAETRLRQLVATISQKSRDLEMVIQTITEHSDQIDFHWLSRYIESENTARQDSLTGLANRRMLDERLDREWSRARRDRQPLAVLMCDIDHFKAYNDRYGHQTGDECLRQVAAVFGETARRDIDVVARYGGEEFVLLLPNTDQPGALKVAADIHAALAQQAIEHEGVAELGRITVSIGVAARIPGDEHVTELLTEADRLLYRAKQRGRNCTCG